MSKKNGGRGTSRARRANSKERVPPMPVATTTPLNGENVGVPSWDDLKDSSAETRSNVWKIFSVVNAILLWYLSYLLPAEIDGVKSEASSAADVKDNIRYLQRNLINLINAACDDAIEKADIKPTPPPPLRPRGRPELRTFG